MSHESRPTKRLRLTRNNLRELQKMVAPEADPEPERSLYSASSIDEDIAYKNGILGVFDSKTPSNLATIRSKIRRRRDSDPPSRKEYQDFVETIETASNEATVRHVTSRLLQHYSGRYNKAIQQAFDSFPNGVGPNDNLIVAQPGMIEGYAQPVYLPFPARDELGGAAVVYQGPSAITLPHLAGEWYGLDDSTLSAHLRARYAGACMVYGRNKALEYLGRVDEPGSAFVSSFATNGKSLSLYVHYAGESPEVADGKLGYHQLRIGGGDFVRSYEEFVEGRNELRNLQDFAKENAQNLREELQTRWLEKLGLDAETKSFLSNESDCLHAT